MATSQLTPGIRIQDSDVFDLEASCRGLRINKMCNALSQAAQRAAFQQDEEAFLEAWGLAPEERELVRQRDFQGLLRAGGNIYFLIKLGVVTGNGLYAMGARMRGESYEAFMAGRNDRGAT